MKKIKFYLGSMWRSYKTKPLIIFLMIFVVCMANVFASYVFKTVKALCLSDMVYNVRFEESSAEHTKVIDEMERIFGKTKYTTLTVDDSAFLSKDDLDIAGGENTYYHFYVDLVRNEADLYNTRWQQGGKTFTVDEFFSKEDFSTDKNYIVIREDDIEAIRRIDRYKDINVGDTVEFNGYQYELRGIKDCFDNFAIINDNVPYVVQRISFEYDHYISIPRFVKLCNEMGVIEQESENYDEMQLIILASLLGLFMIFSTNVIILFNHFMRLDRKLYAEYKMLGAKNYEIFLAMFFAAIPIVVAGSLIGLGVEAIVAGSVWIDERHIYLKAGEYIMIGIMNVAVSLIALIVAAVRRAIKRPVDI